jgi:hypothetical protein
VGARAHREPRFPHRTEPRRQWKTALDATRSEWAAAYEGRVTPFAAMAEALHAVEDASRPATRHGELHELTRAAA